MGGMRALEWAVTYPERVPHAVIIACGAAATAEQIGLCALQIRAIENDPDYSGGDYYDADVGPWRGLSSPAASARSATGPSSNSRSASAAAIKTTNIRSTGGQYTVESYLEYHGEKLARRFDANTYVVLLRR